MPRRGFAEEPVRPKMSRRDSAEIYEIICIFMWFVLAVGMFHVIFFNSVPGLPELQEKYRTDGLIFIGLLFALDTIAILRFDFLAKNREKINFEQSMKDYRSLRDIWLENKKNLMQKEYLPAEDSEAIQNNSEGEFSQKNEPEETSSEE
ncbi:MAG: hypothetical protein CMB51_03950 [Euryarchaeota archaeon]|nr:hypothetical protein [Euryarchaeota archaeon]|tara:strand:+ start:394 stop:840 length:447 start_codon:yes stop_codon:yes gene_type:complete